MVMGPKDVDGMTPIGYKVRPNSVDPDQTAPLGAVRSGSSAVFARLIYPKTYFSNFAGKA